MSQRPPSVGKPPLPTKPQGLDKLATKPPTPRKPAHISAGQKPPTPSSPASTQHNTISETRSSAPTTPSKAGKRLSNNPFMRADSKDQLLRQPLGTSEPTSTPAAASDKPQTPTNPFVKAATANTTSPSPKANKPPLPAKPVLPTKPILSAEKRRSIGPVSPASANPFSKPITPAGPTPTHTQPEQVTAPPPAESTDEPESKPTAEALDKSSNNTAPPAEPDAVAPPATGDTATTATGADQAASDLPQTPTSDDKDDNNNGKDDNNADNNADNAIDQTEDEVEDDAWADPAPEDQNATSEGVVSSTPPPAEPVPAPAVQTETQALPTPDDASHSDESSTQTGVMLYAYDKADDQEISVPLGATVNIMNAENSDWIFVAYQGAKGYIPRAYCQIGATEALPTDTETEPPVVHSHPPSKRASVRRISVAPSSTSDDPEPEASAQPARHDSNAFEPTGYEDGPAIYGNAEAVEQHRNTAETYTPEPLYQNPTEALAPEEFEEDEEDEPVFAHALFDFHATSDSELSFNVGDVIELIGFDEADPWWSGVIGEREGWFPAEFVSIVHDATTLESLQLTGAGDPEQARRQIKRRHVMDELLRTEELYVQDLKMMVEGYCLHMRKHVGVLFTDEDVDIIFCNIEQLAAHNERFLHDLQQAVNSDSIGSCFIKHAEQFKVYSRYCNNHPRAAAALQGVVHFNEQTEKFFQACQLLVEKAISLEGFLLKPVQRICQYPLQLKELIKVTDENHPDAPAIDDALEVMQAMAAEINEDKRNKEAIMQLQDKLDGWTGRDLAEYSTRLIHEGSLIKISGNHMQERHFYLFDNMFVYCKKSLKTMLVKGKIFTENMTVMDLEDGDFVWRKTPINNAIRIKNESKNKWYVLSAKSVEEKEQWLNAFLEERADVERAMMSGTSLINRAVEDTDLGSTSISKRAKSKRQDKSMVHRRTTKRTNK